MAKSVDKVKLGLKLKAQAKDGALTLRLGTKKHTLPFEVRVLNSEEFVFVHIPPAAAIFKITPEGLSEVEDLAEAEKASASFRKPRRRTGGGGRAARGVEMPENLKSALSAIPSGYKLGYDKDGQPKLVKSRKRRGGK
jgi:hypothetical protein